MATAIPEHYSIVLVHGTWGRGFFPKPASPIAVKNTPDAGKTVIGARWFESGSAFRQRLSKSLDLRILSYAYDIRYFEWSGENSFFARHAAAKTLADVIRQAQTENPKSKVVCVGHSHGGNVILHALEHLAPQDRNIEVITLATPFIDIFDNDQIRWMFSKKFGFLCRLFVLLCISFLYLFFPDGFSTDYLEGDLAPVVAPIAFLLGVLILAYYYSFFLTGHFWKSRNPSLRSFSSNNLAGKSLVSLLAIRGVDDEASLVLAFSRIGARLNSIFLVWARQSSVISIVVVLVAVIAIAQYNASAPSVANAICIAIILVSLGGPFLAALFRSMAGRELLFAGADCEVAINSSPDTVLLYDLTIEAPGTSTATLAWDRGLRSLRHYLHEAEYCSEAIAIWLNRHRLRAMRADRDARRKPPA